MLQIERNGEPINVGYTVKNELIPSNDEMRRLVKSIMFSEGWSRTDYSSSYDIGSYTPNVRTFTKSLKHKGGLLLYGSVDLLNEQGTVLGDVDLWNTYSGESTVRGSINLNESYNIVEDDKVKARLVLDFPTHASIGTIKKLQLKHQNPYRTGMLGDNPTHNYKIKYANESAKGIYYDTSCLFVGDDYKLMVAHKKFINYDGKMYSFGQAKTDKRLICTGSRFFYIDTFTNSSVTISEVLFNHKTLTCNLGETYELPYTTYPTSSRISLHLIGIKEVEGKMRLCVHNAYDTSYRGLYFADYDPITFEKVDETAWEKCGAYLNFTDRIDVPLGETGDYKIFYNTTNNCANFYTKSMVTTSDRLGSMCNVVVSIPGTNYDSQYSRGHFITLDGKELICHKASGSREVNGYGHHYTILEKIPNETNNWCPLEITFDEPIVKSSEQTLKIILNIEID